MDFEDDVDTIAFRDFNLTDVSHAMTFATQVVDDVVFDFGNGDILTVENTTVAAVQNDILIDV